MRLFACTLLVALVTTAANATPIKRSVADQIRHPGLRSPTATARPPANTTSGLTRRSANSTASDADQPHPLSVRGCRPSPLV